MNKNKLGFKDLILSYIWPTENMINTQQALYIKNRYTGFGFSDHLHMISITIFTVICIYFRNTDSNRVTYTVCTVLAILGLSCGIIFLYAHLQMYLWVRVADKFLQKVYKQRKD